MRDKILAIVKNEYGLNIDNFKFVPIGEESYAYKIKSGDEYFFVKYTENTDAVENLSKSKQLFQKLSELNFYVGPISVKDELLFQLDKGIVIVTPFIMGTVVATPNPEFDQELVAWIIDAMVQIHQLDVSECPLKNESFTNNYKERFDTLLKLTEDLPSDSRVLGVVNEIKDRIVKKIQIQDNLSQELINSPKDFVLTHGDITGLNIMRSGYSTFLLDWDGVRFAPRERDLVFVEDNKYFKLNEYLNKVGRTSYNPRITEYYRSAWALDTVIENLEKILDRQIHENDTQEYLNEIIEYSH